MSDLMESHRVKQGNIGGSASGPVLPASVGSGAHGQEVSLIQFSGDDKDPQMLTAAIAALTDPLTTGPYVGIVQFASGHGDQQRVEFDIVTNEGTQLSGVGNICTPGGGAVISLVGSSARVSVRNDAAYKPDGVAGLSLGNPAAGGVSFTASLAVGARVGGDSSTQLTITVANQVGGFLAAGIRTFPIPPFARSFRAFRASANESISISLVDCTGLVVDGPYNVAANVPAPIINLIGRAVLVQINNTGGAAIDVAGAIFQLGGV